MVQNHLAVQVRGSGTAAASTQAPPPPGFFASPYTGTARAAEAAVPAGDAQPMEGVQTCNGGDAMLLLLLEASAELSERIMNEAAAP